MGKRKEAAVDEDLREPSPKKKHKHKHKKHKRKREHALESESSLAEETGRRGKSKSREHKGSAKEEPIRPVKLKIKLGGQTMSTKQVAKIVPIFKPAPIITSGEEEEEEEVVEDLNEEDINVQLSESWHGSDNEEGENAKKGDKVESDKEEQAWLDALEAGELDDFGRLKHQKDVSMMTARQRAMLGHEIEGENQLFELPTESRRKNEDSEEAQRRRKQRAKKRKQAMVQQIEENKAQTVKKLLHREATRKQKEEEKARHRKKSKPHVRYISNHQGFSLSFSTGLEFPMKLQASQGLPQPRPKCSVQGCTKDKLYSCSKNNLPVCSLECYKKIQGLTPSQRVLTA